MTIIRFHEYVSAKGKVNQPVVKLDGDNLEVEKAPETPPQGGKPYAAKNDKAKKSSKALGDEGDNELIYEPVTDEKAKGKSPAKIPTVDEMSLAAKISTAAAKNPVVVETLVRQLKNNGLLGALVAEMLNHKETYNHISEVMAHESYGPNLCNKLVRAINEEVAPPFSDQLDPEEEKDDDVEDLENSDQSDGEGVEDEDLNFDDDEDDDLNFDDDEDMVGPEEEEAGNSLNVDPEMEGGSEEDPLMSMKAMHPAMKNNPAMMNFQRAMMKAWMGKH